MIADNNYNQHAATNGGQTAFMAESLGTKTKSMIRNTLKFVWGAQTETQTQKIECF